MGGRGPDTYDCYGLVCEIRRRAGKPVPEDYTHSGDPQGCHVQIEHAAEHYLAELPGPEPFCLVTFKLIPPWTSHIGVVLPSRFQFIHIMRGCRVAIERLDSISWKHRITGYWETKSHGR